MTRKLIVANWKMNPDSLREAKEIFLPVKKAIQKLNKVEVVICPPALFLSSLITRGEASWKKGARLVFGGQDAFWELAGPYTGQISAVMLKKACAKYVILGHSEKRLLGELDGPINLKVKAALREGL